MKINKKLNRFILKTSIECDFCQNKLSESVHILLSKMESEDFSQKKGYESLISKMWLESFANEPSATSTVTGKKSVTFTY